MSFSNTRIFNRVQVRILLFLPPISINKKRAHVSRRHDWQEELQLG